MFPFRKGKKKKAKEKETKEEKPRCSKPLTETTHDEKDFNFDLLMILKNIK